jgi:hypothetical protein
MDVDEVIRLLKNDPASYNYAYLRMKEVVDNAMIADYEN